MIELFPLPYQAMQDVRPTERERYGGEEQEEIADQDLQDTQERNDIFGETHDDAAVLKYQSATTTAIHE